MAFAMNISRRGFFGALASATIAIAATTRLGNTLLAPIAKRWTILHGDGINDDTDAINAFMRSDPVAKLDGTPIVGNLLPRGSYLLSAPIVMQSQKVIAHSFFEYDREVDSYLFFPSHVEGAQIIDNTFSGPEAKYGIYVNHNQVVPK